LSHWIRIDLIHQRKSTVSGPKNLNGSVRKPLLHFLADSRNLNQPLLKYPMKVFEREEKKQEKESI